MMERNRRVTPDPEGGRVAGMHRPHDRSQRSKSTRGPSGSRPPWGAGSGVTRSASAPGCKSNLLEG